MVAKARERASKGMRHESAAQVCTTHIWRSPRKLRKNDPQEKCFCQSYNCAVAKVWRIVCESNCIDEPAGENCHTEVYRGSKTGYTGSSALPRMNRSPRKPCKSDWQEPVKAMSGPIDEPVSQEFSNTVHLSGQSRRRSSETANQRNRRVKALRRGWS